MGVEDFYAQEGFVTNFCRNFFLSRSTEKLGRLILLCCVSESCRQRKVYRSQESIKIF